MEHNQHCFYNTAAGVVSGISSTAQKFAAQEAVEACPAQSLKKSRAASRVTKLSGVPPLPQCDLPSKQSSVLA